VPDRKSFLLRADAGILEAMQRWANDDLRSLNAQVEFVPEKQKNTTSIAATSNYADELPTAFAPNKNVHDPVESAYSNDDFTPENGATCFAVGSQGMEALPPSSSVLSDKYVA